MQQTPFIVGKHSHLLRNTMRGARPTCRVGQTMELYYFINCYRFCLEFTLVAPPLNSSDMLVALYTAFHLDPGRAQTDKTH